MEDPVRSPTETLTATDGSNSSRYIVGLGASAGGLEALRTLFGRLGKVDSLSLIVVQHLAPQHRSRLVELIAHETPLKVQEAADGIEPEPGVIYITPPNADLVYEHGKLHLRNPMPKIGPKPSVDLFLTSLAHGLGDCAIGAILSGTGSDGSHGIRAIKAAGGITLCQKPESAKYDGMPKAALQTGAVDLALTPEQLAEELQRIDRHGRPRLRELGEEARSAQNESPFQHILGILRAQTGVDLDDYKRSTIQRRIERRMQATGSRSLADYSQYLEETAGEAQLLFADILISVTSFFRDAEAFQSLGQCVEEKVRSKHSGEQLRCWVAGCATGEEAFSLAILIREAMERTQKRLRVQIFATDLDEQALLLARKATYSKASLTQLPSELTDKYFTPVEDRLQVVPELRDMVVFAKHNLTEDPPFLGLDVVSCRNVLIYFTSRLQDRVLRTVHYSLDPRGILFLGKSETATQPPGLFDPVDKQSKIYLRTGKGRDLPRLPNRREQQREAHLASEDREASRGHEFLYSLIGSVAPDSVLIDESRRIQQLFGNAGDHLRLPMGEATMVLSKLVEPELAVELQSLLHRADKLGRAVQGRRRDLGEEPGAQQIRLLVIPVPHGGRREYLVAFEECPPEAEEHPAPRPAPSAQEESAEERVLRLEMELKAAREQLQNALEEHDTATEELQALNEELQSTNEELQSSNEELETTNEELQSSNEELTTLNQELNVKSAELQTLNQRLHAVQSAIHYPLLIIDRELRLQNFNPASRFLFRLGEGDIGSTLKAVPSYVDLSRVLPAIERSFSEGKDHSLELQAQGRYFEVKVQLFQAGREGAAGAVVSFVEITDLRQALQDSRVQKQQMKAITENTPALITMKDSQGVYTYANTRFYQLTGLRADDVIGRTDEELFGAEQGGAMRAHDFEVLKQRSAQQSEDRLRLPDGEARWWLASRFPLLDGQNRAHAVCTVALDISERVQHEQELQLFRRALSEATDGLVILTDRGSSDGYRTVFRSGRLVPASVQAASDGGSPLDGVLGQLMAGYDGVDLEALRQGITGEDSSNATYCRDNGGEEICTQLCSTQLEFGEAHPRYLVLMLTDVSQQTRHAKELEEHKEALSRFSRFAALGEVAAGISHELGTPLNAITTKTELLRRMVAGNKIDPQRMEKTTRDIDRMVDNIDQVIAGLKSVSRMSGRNRTERIGVRRLVEDSLQIVRAASRRHRVPIDVELPEPDLVLECNPVQIGQILVNLVNNAIDAVAGQPGAWIRVRAQALNGGIVLEVQDSGPGVPPQIAEKIMAPFFTTKAADKGTGLGLSLSRNIARHHGGELELLPEAEHTTFRVSLPIEAAAVDQEQEEQAES